MRRFELRSSRRRPKPFTRVACSVFVPLATLAGVLLLAASPARAGDEFERGFKDELGRIAAHEAVHVGRHVLRGVVGEHAVYEVHGPGRYAPPHRYPPRYGPPRHHGKHYGKHHWKHHRKHHGKHAWKHHRKHHHKHHRHPGHRRHDDCDWCGGCGAHVEHDYPRYPTGRRHTAYGGW